MPGVFGTYRGVYTSLVDDPDYQQLSPTARHVFQTMRLSEEIGAGCIWRAYLDPIAKRTGYTIKVVENCLEELRVSGWIEWDGCIIWIKNGLRYDPTFKIVDEKHKKNILRRLLSLPKREIVVNFCKYYKLECPFEGPSKTLPPLSPPNPIPSPIPNPIPNPIPSPKVHLANPDGFAAFWSAYPKKLGKSQAEKAWKALNPQNGLVEIIIESIRDHISCEQWRDPQYIPYPASFLNGKRWEDVLTRRESLAERLWREAQEEKRDDTERSVGSSVSGV